MIDTSGSAFAHFRARLSGDTSAGRLFVPDLRIWHAWHAERNTSPPFAAGASLPELCERLGVPSWQTVKPWRMISPNAQTETTETESERSVTLQVGEQTLVSRWSRGPDGDWWQTEYPAKTPEDLRAMLTYISERRFEPAWGILEAAVGDAGDNGIVAAELPARPFAWLMLEVIGWSEGLMLLVDAEEVVASIVEAAERQIQVLVEDLAPRRGAAAFLSPDNLDAMFVSPGYFATYLADGYRAAVDALEEHGQFLLTHTGGPIGPLLAPLAAAGVHGPMGVCGPPQGDTTMEDARSAAPTMCLWGGIPQDYLVSNTAESDLGRSIQDAQRISDSDPRTIVGIADHVPIDADIDRLRRVAESFSTV